MTHNQREFSIPYKTFKSLVLSHLDLTDSHVKDGEFLYHLHAEVLILDDNPLAENVNLQKGAGLKYTKHLSLRNTGIKNIQKKDLAYLSSLEHLDLSQNHLQVFEAGVFALLQHLQVLHLEENSMTNLDGDFDDSVLPSLKELQLHDNRITHLDESLKGLFNRLDAITLHGNPLHCNCQVSVLLGFDKLYNKLSITIEPL